MKYSVHFYIPARVKVLDVEAASQEEAVAKAEEQVDFHDFFSRIDDPEAAAQWDEGAPLGALVDEEGDEDYRNTRYHELPGATSYIKREDQA